MLRGLVSSIFELVSDLFIRLGFTSKMSETDNAIDLGRCFEYHVAVNLAFQRTRGHWCIYTVFANDWKLLFFSQNNKNSYHSHHIYHTSRKAILL